MRLPSLPLLHPRAWLAGLALAGLAVAAQAAPTAASAAAAAPASAASADIASAPAVSASPPAVSPTPAALPPAPKPAVRPPLPAPNLLITTDLTRQTVAPPLAIWREHGQRPDAATVASWPLSRFTLSRADNYGLDERPLWIRLTLQRDEDAPSQVVLQLGRPVWRSVAVYVVPQPAPAASRPAAPAQPASAPAPAASAAIGSEGKEAALDRLVASLGSASAAAPAASTAAPASAAAPPAPTGSQAASSPAAALLGAASQPRPAVAAGFVPPAAAASAAAPQRIAPLHSRHAAYLLNLPPGRSEVLLRLSQLGAITPVITVWNPTDFQRYSLDDSLLQGLFFGLLLALVIYNAFLYLSTRDKVHLAFILWQGATMLYMLVETGLGQQQLWPRDGSINDIGAIGGLMLMGAGGLYFMRTYLLLQQAAPRIDLALQVLQWLSIAVAVVQLLPHSEWLVVPAEVIVAISLLLVALAAALRWAQRFLPAMILLLSLLPLLAVGLANVARVLGLLPENFWTSDALQWVMALLALAMTYGLSVRVAQLRERAQRLQSQLFTDPLTGLLNRNGLYQRGQRLIERSHDIRAIAAVLWIDLDGLKRINDHFGHAAGDALILATAQRLPEVFGPDAACARLGGDEFAAVLPNLPSARLAEDLARLALERLREPVTIAEQPLQSSASIGIALYPQHGQRIEDLLRRADVAMYRAKSAGRDTFVVWEPEMDGDTQASLFMTTQMP